MPIILPPKDHLILSQGDNSIIKNYGPRGVLNDYVIQQGDHCKVTSDSIDYYFTNDEAADLPPEYTYVVIGK